MQVRCPECLQAIELSSDSTLRKIDCPECGSNFNLVGDETVIGEGKTNSVTDGSVRAIGHFTLKKEVGRGAFGTVWLARDQELDRDVAIKVPRRGQLNGDEAERFFREARASAQLQHSNIVTVHEVGRDGDTIFVVSDFVHGVTLSDWLDSQQLTARESAELCVKIADALHHAHEMGIVHRDLKPGNIMMDRDGEPRVMDFGLAKRDTNEVTLTMDGQILGTPAYMSPEQAQGQGAAADRRADIYSLGVVLFQLLTGEIPFRGNVRMLIQQIINDEPPSPRKLNAKIPKDLETICLRCIQKSPQRRYQTMSDVVNDLRRWLKREPIAARPIGRMERLWLWCRRKPVIATLTALIFLITVSGFAAVTWQWQEAERARAEVVVKSEAETRARKNADTARESESVARRKAEQTVVDMYTETGIMASETGNRDEAVLWFANAASLAESRSKRRVDNLTRVKSWCQEISLPVRAFDYPQAPFVMEFHPNSKHLLIETYDPKCHIWNVATNQQWQFPDRVEATHAVWSPDGKQLAFANGDSNVSIVSFPAGSLIQTLNVPEPPSQLAFSPDGSRFAAGGKQITVWSCANWERVGNPLKLQSECEFLEFNKSADRLIEAHKHWFHLIDVSNSSLRLIGKPLRNTLRTETGFAISGGNRAFPPVQIPHEDSVIVLDQKKTLACYSLRDGKRLRTFSVPDRIATCELNSGGDHLAVGYLRGISIFDAESGDLIDQTDRPQHHVSEIAFHEQSDMLLSAQWDRRVVRWQCRNGKLSNPQDLQLCFHVRRIKIAPNGELFATALENGLVQVWNLGGNSKDKHILVPHAERTFVALSPDGQFVAPSGTGKVSTLSATRVYETSTGLPASPEMEVRGLLSTACFSGDGEKLVTASFGGDLSYRAPGYVQVWDWKSGRQIADPVVFPTQPIALAVSPQTEVVAVKCMCGELRLLDLDTGTTRFRVEGVPDTRMNGRAKYFGVDKYTQWMWLSHRYTNISWNINGYENHVRFCPDGSSFISREPSTNKGYDKFAVRNPSTGKLITTFDVKGRVTRFCFSRDGLSLATGTSEGEACVWSYPDCTAPKSRLAHPGWVHDVGFSPDGHHLITSCSDGQVRLWDWQRSALLAAPLSHDSEARAAAFLSGGAVATLTRVGDFRFWDLESGRPISPWRKSSGQFSLAVRADENCAVIAGFASSFDIVDLTYLRQATKTQPSNAEIRLFGEVVAGRTINAKGAVVNLTAPEWLDRWKKLEAMNSDLLPDISSSRAPTVGLRGVRDN